MIHIIDDWYVTVETNPTNYIVRRGNGKKGKNGKHLDKARGYFNTLRSAVKFIRDQIIAEAHENGEGTLQQALSTISEVDKRFEKIMEAVTV